MTKVPTCIAAVLSARYAIMLRVFVVQPGCMMYVGSVIASSLLYHVPLLFNSFLRFFLFIALLISFLIPYLRCGSQEHCHPSVL